MSVQDAATEGGSGLLEEPAVETDLIGRLLAEFDNGAWRRWLSSEGLELLVWVLVVFVAAWLANRLARLVIVRGTRALIGRTRTTWDDVLVEHRVFLRLSQLAPALVMYVAASVILSTPERAELGLIVRRLANVWMILAGGRALSALCDAGVDLGRRHKATRDKPLSSYAQVVKIVLWLAVAIFAIATLMGKSPWGLFTGLGAMTAILLLVFKDSILGFVASIQIAGSDVLRIGDWVEMPKYGADGDVIEIGLHTVKISNWDKTISAIPTKTFVTDSFKNWRGMTQSGGRRIKRALAIDMSSVRFLEADDLERLGKIDLLSDYLTERGTLVRTWNSERGISVENEVNGRRLTNLGTFRAYIQEYLAAQPDIRDDMTFLVRQLPPGPEGLPIEIYVFSREQRWVEYEGIIADIFDHLLAALSEFDLRAYQRPVGADLTEAFDRMASLASSAADPQP